jgi:diphthamide synthase (EF-2-diphthine--ammonia ligase)
MSPAAPLRDLPAGVDPCGENGELHTFVWDGPGFALGERVLRDGRSGPADLLRAEGGA